MRSDYIAYAGLLVAGLGVAYWASIPVKDADGEKVTLWDLNPESITSIKYDGSEMTVDLQKDGDSSKRYWVNWDKRPNPKDPLSKAEKDRFLASDEIADVLNGFHPFRAQRPLGKVNDEQMNEFGLKDSAETLTVQAAGSTFELKLGKKSYGSRNQFAFDPKENKVYLVDGRVLQTLSAAKSRLYERRLTALNAEDIVKVTVEAGAKKKVFVRGKKEDGSPKWTEEGKDVEKSTFANWFDKVNKLRTLAFASAEETASLSGQPAFLTVTFEKEGQPAEKMEFRKGEVALPTPVGTPEPGAKPADKTGYFVASDFLKVTVRLATARVEPVEKDLPSVLE